jgi:uncharacterized protein YndB with AHSA1/START domain
MTSEILFTNSDSQIVTTRILNFPQKHVYEAWSDLEHLKNCWGPKGFTNPFTNLIFVKAENGALLCMP